MVLIEATAKKKLKFLSFLSSFKDNHFLHFHSTEVGIYGIPPGYATDGARTKKRLTETYFSNRKISGGEDFFDFLIVFARNSKCWLEFTRATRETGKLIKSK